MSTQQSLGASRRHPLRRIAVALTFMAAAALSAVVGYSTGLPATFAPAAVAAAPLAAPADLESWMGASPMIDARAYHISAPLPGGEVLVLGGVSNPGIEPGVEVYDPVADEWHAVGGLIGGHRHWQGGKQLSASLPNGDVIVAGGCIYVDSLQSNCVGPNGTATAQIYDRGSEMWTAAGTMSTTRSGYYTVSPIGDNGEIAVVGGQYQATSPLTTVDIYDSVANSWTVGPPLSTPRLQHTATTLNDGRLLVVGGWPAASSATYTLLYLDPVDGWKWTPAATLPGPPRNAHAALRLDDGRVLVTGGAGTSGPLASTMIFDPAAAVDPWQSSDDLNTGTYHHWMSRLPDGSVLLTYLSSAGSHSERWSGSGWTDVGAVGPARNLAQVATIPGLGVLATGGEDTVNHRVADADVFSAPAEEPCADLCTLDARLASIESCASPCELDTRLQTAEAALALLPTIQGQIVDLEAEVDGLQQQVADLEAQAGDLAGLEARLAALETLLTDVSRSGNDLSITGASLHVVSGDLTVDGGSLQVVNGDAEVAGGNLHVVNGTDNTATRTGTGNVIIGYNETRGPGLDNRTGSHMLVIGERNNYTAYGGMVVGYQNEAGGVHANVIGGDRNVAGGNGANVIGGTDNAALGPNAIVSGGGGNHAVGASSSVLGGSQARAMGFYAAIVGGSRNEIPDVPGAGFAAICGGEQNTASGNFALAAGGRLNNASGAYSSATGGSDNRAMGPNSTTSGGQYNLATGTGAAVTGGAGNTAGGVRSSVSGGAQGRAYGYESSIGGGAHNLAIGSYSAVSGGSGNRASGSFSAVSGGKNRSSTGQYHWRAGGLFQAQ